MLQEIATDPDLHEFLGIPEYNGQAQEEQQKQQQRERQREFRPQDSKPETFLKVIEKAKLDGDRTSEAQGFNALGLLYCESGLENEGLQVLEKSPVSPAKEPHDPRKRDLITSGAVYGVVAGAVPRGQQQGGHDCGAQQPRLPIQSARALALRRRALPGVF
jgi:hypothetical protein